MSNVIPKSWKNHLQEYCQKAKFLMPNYRIRSQTGTPPKFQAEVEVNGRWYTGEENCLSKKEAESSAAQKACADFQVDNEEHLGTDSVADDNDPSKHFPPEYADIEEFIVTMLLPFSARIRKVKLLDGRGLYKVEITGGYRYCKNIERPHKNNQVYLLVDPVKRFYYERCHDVDCKGYQSGQKPICTNPQVHNSTSDA